MTYVTHLVGGAIDHPPLDGSGSPATYRDSFDVRLASEEESAFIRMVDGRGAKRNLQVRNSASKQGS